MFWNLSPIWSWIGRTQLYSWTFVSMINVEWFHFDRKLVELGYTCKIKIITFIHLFYINKNKVIKTDFSYLLHTNYFCNITYMLTLILLSNSQDKQTPNKYVVYKQIVYYLTFIKSISTYRYTKQAIYQWNKYRQKWQTKLF